MWRQLRNKWPLVWRSRFDAVTRAYDLSQRSWNAEIVRERARADEAYDLATTVIRRVSHLRWERNGPYYAVRVEFDQRAAGGVDRCEMKFFAEC